MTTIHRIGLPTRSWPLYDAAGTRSIEARAAADRAPHSLMQQAGLAVAKLALAVAPDAQRYWVAAGPGNNGGDGFEAAMHLRLAGKHVRVGLIGDSAQRPTDAAASLSRALAAGVVVEGGASIDAKADLLIDALLGVGGNRAAEGAMAQSMAALNRHRSPCIAVDLPSGLDGDSGVPRAAAVRAAHTLALLTLKPGLFTAAGRDHAGSVWFDDLGSPADTQASPPRAWLGGADAAHALRHPRLHAQHKGSFGDVVVVGGATGMVGAALLAARAALRAGAGRVYVNLLDPAAQRVDSAWPELMLRPQAWRDVQGPLADATIVCGCGGGDMVRETLPLLLGRAARLVLDADALNAVAHDEALQALLMARADRGLATVLTPHPLEAARLHRQAAASSVQDDRLGCAEALAARLRCTVLLKGSGSVIAAADQVSVVNASGNARLASAGTGDVLAGWLGGLWATSQGRGGVTTAFDAARSAAWHHGLAAEGGDLREPLTASALLARLGETATPG